jgi:hypothetical protein
VWRESWRLTGEEIDALALPDDETEAYLAGRRLAVKRELPSQCYARLSSERKPIYVDFTSPLFVSLLCSSVRSGRRLRSDLKVTLTEMLPTTEQVWPRSARGDRHVGEIRFHITDPEPARGLDG